MDTRQLAAFCAVVERKSFSQAAERLGVTQPAVSLQIRSLEQRLAQPLLERPDLEADGGLRHPEPLGRLREALALDDHAEGRQLARVHKQSLS